MDPRPGQARATHHRGGSITAASHDPKGSRVSTPCGTVDLKHNRTVGIEKARSGRGTGCRLAFEFELGSLKLKELGLITKELR